MCWVCFSGKREGTGNYGFLKVSDIVWWDLYIETVSFRIGDFLKLYAETWPVYGINEKIMMFRYVIFPFYFVQIGNMTIFVA